jgi:hypoxanthine phosphoribosyltransferase
LVEDQRDRRWRWISTEQLTNDAKLLAQSLPWPIRGIVGLPRGGVMVGAMVASYLNVPLYVIAHDGQLQPARSSGRRLNEDQFQSGPLVLIDDDTFSGLTIQRVIPHLPSGTLTAAVYCWSGGYQPDYAVRRFPCTWLAEWRAFSSEWTVRRMAFDFDGILCHDCPADADDDGPRYLNFLRTARPLWLPRPHQVPLIATARRDAYRSETVTWLQRYGVSVKQLEMGDWPDLSQRSLAKVVALKADAFARSDCTWFAESDPCQAELIAARVPRPVICPAAGRVFNEDRLTEP